MNIEKLCGTFKQIYKSLPSDSGIKNALNDDTIKSVLFGKYTDGTARNFVDALNGEYLSPKQKKKFYKKGKKGKKGIKKFRF